MMIELYSNYKEFIEESIDLFKTLFLSTDDYNKYKVNCTINE